MKRFGVFFGIIIFLFIPLVYCNELSVYPSSLTIEKGNSLLMNIFINTSNNDIYAIQFYVSYDSSILEFYSITEGLFLNNNSEDNTIFNYTLINGKIKNIFLLRNKTIGLFGQGILTNIDFNAINAGTSQIILQNVVWVNSTITNDSAETISPIIENGVVTVTDSSLFSGGNSGGGGGSSGAVVFNTDTNFTNNSLENSTASIGIEINEKEEEDERINKEVSRETGSSPLTGKIIENIFDRKIFLSWIFWFIIGLIAVFVGIIIFKKYYLKKFKNKKHKH